MKYRILIMAAVLLLSYHANSKTYDEYSILNAWYNVGKQHIDLSLLAYAKATGEVKQLGRNLVCGFTFFVHCIDSARASLGYHPAKMQQDDQEHLLRKTRLRNINGGAAFEKLFLEIEYLQLVQLRKQMKAAVKELPQLRHLSIILTAYTDAQLAQVTRIKNQPGAFIKP